MLLECPGASLALELQNAQDMTPPEMAHLNGHVDLAHRLFNFKAHQNEVVEENNNNGAKQQKEVQQQQQSYDYLSQQQQMLQKQKQQRILQQQQQYAFPHRSRVCSPGAPSGNLLHQPPNASSTPNKSSASEVYQIPPPPRPVDHATLQHLQQHFQQGQQPYLDMSGSGSGGDDESASASPKLKRRDMRTSGGKAGKKGT